MIKYLVGAYLFGVFLPLGRPRRIKQVGERIKLPDGKPGIMVSGQELKALDFKQLGLAGRQIVRHVPGKILVFRERRQGDSGSAAGLKGPKPKHLMPDSQLRFLTQTLFARGLSEAEIRAFLERLGVEVPSEIKPKPSRKEK